MVSHDNPSHVPLRAHAWDRWCAARGRGALPTLSRILIPRNNSADTSTGGRTAITQPSIFTLRVRSHRTSNGRLERAGSTPAAQPGRDIGSLQAMMTPRRAQDTPHTLSPVGRGPYPPPTQ